MPSVDDGVMKNALTQRKLILKTILFVAFARCIVFLGQGACVSFYALRLTSLCGNGSRLV